MTAPLMLNIYSTSNKCKAGTAWNLEEVKSEQVTTKEACISWKSRPKAAGLIVFIVSRS